MTIKINETELTPTIWYCEYCCRTLIILFSDWANRDNYHTGNPEASIIPHCPYCENLKSRKLAEYKKS
jgi:hypothetical protein